MDSQPDFDLWGRLAGRYADQSPTTIPPLLTFDRLSWLLDSIDDDAYDVLHRFTWRTLTCRIQ